MRSLYRGARKTSTTNGKSTVDLTILLVSSNEGDMHICAVVGGGQQLTCIVGGINRSRATAVHPPLFDVYIIPQLMR